MVRFVVVVARPQATLPSAGITQWPEPNSAQDAGSKGMISACLRRHP